MQNYCGIQGVASWEHMALGSNFSKVHMWEGWGKREEGRKSKGRGLCCVEVVLMILEIFEERESL